jgi:hypothetical protein
MLGYHTEMATRIPKPSSDEQDFIPEGPELDALIKAKVAEADSNPAPGIPMRDVFEGLRARHAERTMRGG